MLGLLLLASGVVLVGQVALAAVLAVKVVGHEDSGATHGVSALTAKTNDLALGVHLVELQSGKGDLLVLVMGLLWLGEGLLLALLGSSLKAEHGLKSGVVQEALTNELLIHKLAAGGNQAESRGVSTYGS
jgi:hypothetical protein